MFRKPKFQKPMKNQQPTARQDEKPAVTLETAERLANDAYAKAYNEAFTAAKGLFDTSLQIDQKMSTGIKQVNTWWRWYIGLFSAIAGIAAYFGVPKLIKDSVTEQFAGDEVQKQLKEFTDEKVASMIRKGVTEIEVRINAELDEAKKESNELQAALLSVHGEIESVSEEIQESRFIIDVYEQIAAARAGDRLAYEALRQTAKGSNRVAHIASLGVAGIVESFEERRRTWGRARMGLQNLQTGETAITIPPEEAMYYVYTDSSGVCEGALNNLADRNQSKFVATMVYAVDRSKDLNCVYAGIRCLEKLLGKQFPALGIDEVLSWWEEHNEDETYHYAFEKVCEIFPQPNETEASFKWRQAMAWEKWIVEEPEQYWVAQRLIIFLLNTREDGIHKRKEMLEYALEYWANEQPRQENWYLAKALYLYLYGSEKEFIDFVNARLAEHPSFEKELRQYENELPKHFFQRGPIHWPSQTNIQVGEGGTEPEKVAE